MPEVSSVIDLSFFNLRLEIPMWAMYWLIKERPLVNDQGIVGGKKQTWRESGGGYMDKQRVNMLTRPKHQQESEKQSQSPRATEKIWSTDLEEGENSIWTDIVIIKDTQMWIVTSVNQILKILLLKDHLCDMDVLEIMQTLCILYINYAI